MKLNLGDGGVEIDGYTGRDIVRGEEIAELPYDDNSIEEIRASHCLEHFAHGDVPRVLAEWVRVLQPGGLLKVAVPDFGVLAEQYRAGAELPFQAYIMGGQTSSVDFHRSLFDFESLSEAMRDAGLVGITRWHGGGEDCASLPISLNLCGTKQRASYPKIVAHISMPRLGFNDFWACAFKELSALHIPLKKLTGAYWDHVLECGIRETLDEGAAEWILTLDYDTVFTRDQLLGLIETAIQRPHIDALAPIQSARHEPRPLFTVADTGGQKITKMKRADLQAGAVIAADSAHFGMTLIKAEKLRQMPQPWFKRMHGDAACDPDVQFWRAWKAAGNSLYVALRVPVGHCELMVRWPGRNLMATYQLPQEFTKHGPPDDVWQ